MARLQAALPKPPGGRVRGINAGAGPVVPPTLALGPTPLGDTGATGPEVPPAGAAAATGPEVPPLPAPAAGGPEVPPPAGALGPKAPGPDAETATGPTATGPTVTTPPVVSAAQDLGKFARFGQDYFSLSTDKSQASVGAPSVTDREGFVERFGTDAKIQQVVARYWRVDNILRMPVSEPRQNEYRVPCDKNDLELMKQAFANYLAWTNKQISSFGPPESAEKSFYSIQAEHIQAYIDELNNPSPRFKCVERNETVEPIQVPAPGVIQAIAGGPGGPVGPVGPDGQPLDDYYSVVPKIFYLLYQNQKQQNPLDVSSIFAAYPSLNQRVWDYLDSLDVAGPFESERGLYDMANGVVELFFELRRLFPRLYGSLIPTPETYQRWAAAGFPVPPAGAPATGVPGVAPGTGVPGAPPGAAPGPAAPAAAAAGTEVSPDDFQAAIEPIITRMNSVSDEARAALLDSLRRAHEAYRAGNQAAALAQIQAGLTALANDIQRTIGSYTNFFDSFMDIFRSHTAITAMRIAALSQNPIGQLGYLPGQPNEAQRAQLTALIQANENLFPEGDPRRLAMAGFRENEARLDEALANLQGKRAEEAAAAAAAAGPALAPGESLATIIAERDLLLQEVNTAHDLINRLGEQLEELRKARAAGAAEPPAAGAAGAAGAAEGDVAAQLAAAQAQLAEKTRALDAANARLATLEAALAPLQAELDALRAAQAGLQQAAARGTTGLQDLQARLEAAQKQLADQAEATAKLRADYEAAVAAGQGRGAEADNLRRQLAESQAAEARAQETLRGLRGLQEQLGDLTAQAVAQEDRIRQLEADLAAARAAGGAGNARAQGIQADLDAARAQLAQLQQQIDTLGTTNTGLLARIAELERTLAEANGSIGRLGPEVDRARAEAGRVRTELTALLEAARAESTRLRGEVDTKESQRAALEAAERQAREALEAANRRAQEAEARVTDLTARLAALQRELDAARVAGTDADGLRARVDDLTGQLTQAQADATAAQQARVALQAQLAAAQQESARILADFQRDAAAALDTARSQAAQELAAAQATAAQRIRELEEAIARGDQGAAEALRIAREQLVEAQRAAAAAAEAARQQIAGAEAEAEAARGQRDSEAAQKQAALADAASERAAKLAAEQRVQQLQGQLDALTAERDALQAQLAQLQAAQGAAGEASGAAIAEKEAEIARLTARIGELEAELTASRAGQTAALDAYQAALQQARDQQEQCDAAAAAARARAEADLATERARREAAEAEAARLASLLEGQEGTIGQAAQLVAGLSQEKAELQGEKDAAEAALADQIAQKKALYKRISELIESLMHQVGAHSGELSKLPGQSGLLKGRLDAPLTAEYNESIPVDRVQEQQNMQVFSAAMQELEHYLSALDGHYPEWKTVFEGGRCGPAVDPAAAAAAAAPRPALRLRIKAPGVGGFDRQYDVYLVEAGGSSLDNLMRGLNADIGGLAPNLARTSLTDLFRAGVTPSTLQQFIANIMAAGYLVEQGDFGVPIVNAPAPPPGAAANAGVVPQPPAEPLVGGPINQGPDYNCQPPESLTAKQFAYLTIPGTAVRNYIVSNGASPFYGGYVNDIEADIESCAYSLLDYSKARTGGIATRPRNSSMLRGVRYKTVIPALRMIRDELRKTVCIHDRQLQFGGGARLASPYELPDILKKQEAWTMLNNAYNAMDPEIRKHFAEPPPAPLNDFTDPFNVYIDREANADALDEAREALGMLAPKDIDAFMADNRSITPAMASVIVKYKEALSRVDPAWLPVLVQADILRIV